MIEIRQVTKLYKTVIGVNDITLNIEPGTYGLLGPNGSGKTTLINLILGQIKPTIGSIRLFGENPWRRSDLLRRVGLCPASEVNFPGVTALEWVTYLVQLHGFGFVESERRAKEAIETVKLTHAMKRPMRDYSLGMRQRAKIAQAIAHDPDLLILDEPFNGLDPIGRFEMTDFLRSWAARNKSLILASHILYEVESVQPSFLLISGGRLLASGSPAEVREILADAPYTLQIRTSDAKRLVGLLIDRCQIESVQFHSNESLQITTRAVGEVYQLLPGLLAEHQLSVSEISSTDDSLKTLFSTLMKMHRGEWNRGGGMKRWLMGSLATCRFELRRSFTVQRVAVSIVLALFPPMMVALVIGATKVAQAAAAKREVVESIQLVQGFAPFAIVFLVSLVCLLSLLLWATPNVYSELEGKSWSFIACRPGGRISTYLGKFLASVLVSFSVSMIALTLSVLIADRMLSLPEPERLWISLSAIYLIACCVYGAIFSMLGTLFYKRAMVVAAGYLIGSEVFLATIPAVIGKLTMRFHLQELGIRWIGFFLPFENQDEYRMLYGTPWPTWANLAMLIGVGLATLIIGAFVIVNRQYITSDET